MDVKYVDGPAAVMLDGVGRVKRGEIATVPDGLGAKLLNQGWEQASLSATPKPEPAKTVVPKKEG